MELHQVPNNTRIRVIKAEAPPPGGLPTIAGTEYNFKHIDGMYSFCTTDSGDIVHLKAWTEVEIVPSDKERKVS